MNISHLLLVLLPLQTMAANYLFMPDKGLEYSWQTDDKIGITLGVESYGYTEQLCFWTSSAEGATRNHRSLYATGYSLKDNTRYYAYCPYRYSGNFSATALRFPYTGQQQTGNSSTAALYAYDYRMAAATTANGACYFDLQRIGCVLRIATPAPAEAHYTQLQLTATNEEGEAQSIIPTAATANLLTAAVTMADSTSTFDLSLCEVSLKKDETMVAYLMLPALDLSGNRLNLELKDDSGNTTNVATIKGFKASAGYLYNIDLTPQTAKAKTATTAAKGVSGFSPESTATTAASAKGVSGFSPESSVQAVATPLAYTPDIPLDPAFTLEVIPQQPPGDVNNDGTVNTTDADLVISHYLGTLPADATFNKAAADINNDGTITVTDANAIINIITNK